MTSHETERLAGDLKMTLLETLRRLAATALAVFQNRLELLMFELREERARFFNALLLTAAVVTLGFFTLAIAAGALVVVAWDEFGAKGLLLPIALGAAGTWTAYARLRLALQNWPRLSQTLKELQNDRDNLESFQAGAGE